MNHNCLETARTANSACPLVLGTAQLGLPYGIANKTGLPDQTTATAIVREAWENGICEFDTGQAYGDSEGVLGKALSKLGIIGEVRIISKFDPDLNHLDPVSMSGALDQSLKKLGVPYLFGILLHREEMLSLLDKGLAEILHKLLLSGRVQYIGASVYSPDKAVEALKTEGIDIVQIPTNILDRRFEKAGVFELADQKKKQLYIRSIFLQGLLLMDPEEISTEMIFTRPILEKVRSISRNLGMTRQQMALCYIKGRNPKAKIVFGADCPSQVKENCISWNKNLPESFISLVNDIFAQVDEQVLNPALWPKQVRKDPEVHSA
ncbi:MAG: aldo/keto reductase [Thermodesulfobacteriota bacterium]